MAGASDIMLVSAKTLATALVLKGCPAPCCPLIALRWGRSPPRWLRTLVGHRGSPAEPQDRKREPSVVDPGAGKVIQSLTRADPQISAHLFAPDLSDHHVSILKSILDLRRISDRFYLFSGPARTANCYGPVVEYHSKIRLGNIDAFDLLHIDVHRPAHPSSDDHAAVCNNDFCARLFQQCEADVEAADGDSPQGRRERQKGQNRQSTSQKYDAM